MESLINHTPDIKPARRAERPFVPELLIALREGYGLAALRADVLAGLTVAVVALPLSLALAIASGVAPARGLFTAVIAGRHRLGAGRQPPPDRRPHRRFRGRGGGHRAALGL